MPGSEVEEQSSNELSFQVVRNSMRARTSAMKTRTAGIRVQHRGLYLLSTGALGAFAYNWVIGILLRLHRYV